MKSIKLKPIYQNQLFINPDKLINSIFKMTAVFCSTSMARKVLLLANFQTPCLFPLALQ